MHDTALKKTHPLLITGDAEAGTLFVKLLMIAVPSSTHRVNRGFDEKAIEKICAGTVPVSEDAVRQVLLDYRVTGPKAVTQGHDKEYNYMLAICNGKWDAVPKVRVIMGTSAPPKAPSKEQSLVQVPSGRIFDLYRACGVQVLSKDRDLFSSTSMLEISRGELARYATAVNLPAKVILGQLNFNHGFTPVAPNERWIGPHRFFIDGDDTFGRQWSRVVTFYRRERKYFADTYQMGPDKLSSITNGEVGVSIPVFVELINHVQTRLAQNPQNVQLRAFKSLVQLAENLPAQFIKETSHE